MKKQESGRSMVEMLGVLAIIGVLSIGGIAGYTMAMNRYRANAVIDAANKYALILYSTYQNAKVNGVLEKYPAFLDTGLGNLSGGKLNDATITITANPVTSNSGQDTVAMSIAFTATKVCEAAASTIGGTCSSNTVTYEVKQN